MFKKIANSLRFALFLGLLSSCSPTDLLPSTKNQSPANQAQNNTDFGSAVALPPRLNTANTPLKPGQTPTATLPNGLPALKPAKGINLDTLFSERLKNDDERFNRVENAVLDLRKEFEAFKPSIVRLSAVESDIQNLVRELEVLLEETPPESTYTPPTPIANAPAQLNVQQLEPQPKNPVEITHQKAPEKTQAKPASQPIKKKPQKKFLQYQQTVADNFRAGEHTGKVRIVIDTNRKAAISTDLDNDEKLMVIEMPTTRWVGRQSSTLPFSKLIDSYTVEPINNGSGSLLIIDLKRHTSIIAEKHLKPTQDTAHHRVYFDLKL